MTIHNKKLRRKPALLAPIDPRFPECRFLLSAPATAFLPPPDRPEVCFAGRSNVGKSSLINALANQRKLARTSNTPGRTREINIFGIGSSHYLADLPGYGYARMSKSIAARAAGLIDAYVSERSTLRRVFVLIDGRRGPMQNDEEFLCRLDTVGSAFQIIATKLDKVTKSGSEKLWEDINSVLKSHPAALAKPLGVSSKTGEGLQELRQVITEIR